jgi:hypothetical protein
VTRRRRILGALVAGPVALVACARLLGLAVPGGPRVFAHRAHVLEGISCLRCHAGVDRAGDVGPPHLPDTAICLDCHEAPHDSRPCATCHGLPGARQSAQDARHHLRFEHRAHMARAKGNCVKCHVDIARDAVTLRPAMPVCFGCHAHEDAFHARDCAACHVDLRAENTTPQSHVVHDDAFVREHGMRAAGALDLCATCHGERFCASCHAATAVVTPDRIRFYDPLGPGVHRAGFRARHADEARVQPGLCTTCHSEDACADCHAGAGVAAADVNALSPHPPGWLGLPGQRNDHGRAAWLEPATCASCHGGAGEALCIGCHQSGGIGGNPHAPGWSSTLGKDQLPCRLCHRSAW